MKIIVARFDWRKLGLCTLSIFILSAIGLTYPYYLYGGMGNFFMNSRFSISWPFGAACAVITAISYIYVIFSAIFNKFEGMYIKQNILHTKIPFSKNIVLSNIVDIYAPNENSLSRIIVIMQDGSYRYIATFLFLENRQEIIQKINEIRSGK